MPPPTIDASTRRRWPWLAGAAGVVALGGWYLWPSLSGNPGDVAVVTDDASAAVLPMMGNEVRARGRGLVDLGAAADWCELAAAAPRLAVPDGVDFVVVVVGHRGDCAGDPVGDALAAIDHHDAAPVVVLLPGSEVGAADLPDDVRTAPVEHLLGPPGQRTAGCEWWNDCPPGGAVEVRDAAGDLADEGLWRVARVVASVVG